MSAVQLNEITIFNKQHLNDLVTQGNIYKYVRPSS